MGSGALFIGSGLLSPISFFIFGTSTVFTDWYSTIYILSWSLIIFVVWLLVLTSSSIFVGPWIIGSGYFLIGYGGTASSMFIIMSDISCELFESVSKEFYR